MLPVGSSLLVLYATISWEFRDKQTEGIEQLNSPSHARIKRFLRTPVVVAVGGPNVYAVPGSIDGVPGGGLAIPVWPTPGHVTSCPGLLYCEAGDGPVGGRGDGPKPGVGAE